MRYIGVAIVMVIAALSGCVVTPPRPELARLPREETSLKDIATFFEAVGSADTIIVYEGLPHPTWDREVFQSESKRRDLIRFAGYTFYAKPLGISPADERKLTEIALRREAHVSFGGYKLCGGYHPDYAVIWKRGDEVSGSLICFGCHEWKNFTPVGRLYEDIEQSAYKDLQTVLSKYSINRPKRAGAR